MPARVATGLMIPLRSPTAQAGPVLARFTHENGTQLRLQAFLLVRDSERRVAAVRLRDNPGEWRLPGEVLRLNESPLAAGPRVAAEWFKTPLAPTLVDVYNYPATGPGDDKWYVLFVFEARLGPGESLVATDDTEEVRFVAPGTSPGPWALSHADVWERLG